MELYSLKDKDAELLKKGLKRARMEAGLTQDDLRKALGVSLKTVMNWEQGVCPIKLPALINLAEFYGVSLDYLAGRIDCKTHDAQFIQDKTGLSEKAIEKLQDIGTEPDWEQLELHLKASAPDIPEDKLHESVQRQREGYQNSIKRCYAAVLSLLIEHRNFEYLLSLITQRVKRSRKRSTDSPLTHEELVRNDLWLEIDGQKILAHKSNMLDSLIQSEVASIIPQVSEDYHER